MTIAFIGLVAVIVAVLAILVLRGKKPPAPHEDLPRVATVPVPTPIEKSAPAPELKMVSCTVGHGVHGAMPPFGRLQSSEQGLVFEASSRVMAASNAGFAMGDDASTMQSVGSVEMGQFHFDVARADLQRVESNGTKVVFQTSQETYTFEGIGPTAKLLQPWLRDHGYSV